MNHATTTAPPLAFHGDPVLKAHYLGQIAAHRAADQLIQGCTWNQATQKGCMIGCLFHRYDHAAGSQESGLPEELLRLADMIFEGLTVAESRGWPERFLAAIHPGVNLARGADRFRRAILTDSTLDLHGKADEAGRAAIAGVVALLDRRITGDDPTESEWSAARSAARSAAAQSAQSARSAAWSARSAAESAAWSRITDLLLTCLATNFSEEVSC